MTTHKTSFIRAIARRLLPASLAALLLVAGTAAQAGKPQLDAVGAPGADGFVATRAKKPGSGVDLAYRIDGTPAAKSPTALTLRFTGVSAPEGARVTITAPDGLSIDGQRQRTLSAAAAAQEMRLAVTAAADGVYYVNVTTEQAGRSHVTSVPVTVGKGQLKLQKNGNVQTMPNGERVVSMPSR